MGERGRILALGPRRYQLRRVCAGRECVCVAVGAGALRPDNWLGARLLQRHLLLGAARSYYATEEVRMVEKDNNVKVASAMLHLSAAQTLLANVRDKGELPAHSAMWAAVSLACERARAAANVLGEALTLRLEED